jgi:hypothetical protein
MSRPIKAGEKIPSNAECWVCGRTENFEEVGKDPDTGKRIYTCGDCCEELRILYHQARKEFGDLIDLDKLEQEMYCDVCNKQGIRGVASSILGAISFAYCEECLIRGAEPLSMWHNTIDICGGPDEVADDYKAVAVAFKDGHYLNWHGILACYEPLDSNSVTEEDLR